MGIRKHEQLDADGFEVWDEKTLPLAYLITVRTYGTWLHGDERTSVKRDGWNHFGHPRYRPNASLESWMRAEMNGDPVLFCETMRNIADVAVRDLCKHRGYSLYALNVRSNHLHAVIAAAMKPERIADAVKAAVTKSLRLAGYFSMEAKVWSRGRSRRYLWKPSHVKAAVEYTHFGQGDFILPD